VKEVLASQYVNETETSHWIATRQTVTEAVIIDTKNQPPRGVSGYLTVIGQELIG
jgi:hypothetical protein